SFLGHAGIEETFLNISPGAVIYCTLLHKMPWMFTIPWLNGSLPLHSIVILIQGVETDSV
ncbi:hypothetical protein ACFQI7_37870, partial [Paenibacillus allorhizosphaerae]